jgi:hypothetical protein
MVGVGVGPGVDAKIGAGTSVSVGAGVDVLAGRVAVDVDVGTVVAFPAFVGTTVLDVVVTVRIVTSATVVVVTGWLDEMVVGATWFVDSAVAVLVGRAVRVARGVSVGSGGGSGAAHAARINIEKKMDNKDANLNGIDFTLGKICAASISQGGMVSNSLTPVRFYGSIVALEWEIRK